MKIGELELNNFKGVRALTLNFNGQDARIRGDNATGKTTVMDAFIWLLTGKDHLGRSDQNFNIKTLDETGAAIPMLDHSVRAVLEHDGSTFELVRTFKEVWQKKTGTNAQTFNGHKTEYSINGVPKSEKEYTAFIEMLAPMQLIYLLTMPGYFNEQIKAEERRKMLLDMCGDVDESSILALPEFAELAPQVTRMVSVSDLKKSNAAQKTKINDDIKNIPVQINVHAQYLNADGLNADTERAAISDLSRSIEEREMELRGLSNGETLARRRKELTELETEYAQFLADQKKEIRQQAEVLENSLSEAGTDVVKLEYAVRSAEQKVDIRQREAAAYEKSRARLLDEYHKLEEQEYTGDTICPTCGQPLPTDKVEAAVGQFNENKSKRLEEMVTDGKRLVSEIAAANADVDDGRKKITQFSVDKAAALKKVDTIKDQIIFCNCAIRPGFDMSKIEAKKAEVQDSMSAANNAGVSVAAEVAKLKEEKSEHERNLSRLQNAENAAREIKRLEAKEKGLATAFEECEKIIALCDDFTNAKVKMLDERISGAFRFARFKLTETLVNGGMKEICDTMVGGVPYSAANNAARINVGLDIIETFSAHYGITMPIFVDNSESVTQLYPMDCHRADMERPQIIQLIVSEAYKKLTMEVN